MIKTINSWRGIFALCIVCFHFEMHEFDQLAYFGVTFFFMLSGFLVTYKQSCIKSYKEYYTRRLFRIYPLHWLALSAMIVLDLVIMHKFIYGWDLPFHIALLQSWIPQEKVFYNYSIHSWFLSSMAFCIIATPLLFKLFNSISRKMAWLTLGVACVTVLVLNLYADDNLRSYLHVCPTVRLVDYSIGMVIGLTLHKRSLSHDPSLLQATAIETGALLFLAALIVFHKSGSPIALSLESTVLWWVPAALLITSCTLLNGHEGVLGKLLKLRPLVWLGSISFEIYILQKFVNNLFCFAIAPFFGHYGVILYGYSFEFTVPMLIIIAWIVHRYFTIPIGHLHTNKISKT